MASAQRSRLTVVSTRQPNTATLIIFRLLDSRTDNMCVCGVCVWLDERPYGSCKDSNSFCLALTLRVLSYLYGSMWSAINHQTLLPLISVIQLISLLKCQSRYSWKSFSFSYTCSTFELDFEILSLLPLIQVSFKLFMRGTFKSLFFTEGMRAAKVMSCLWLRSDHCIWDPFSDMEPLQCLTIS